MTLKWLLRLSTTLQRPTARSHKTRLTLPNYSLGCRGVFRGLVTDPSLYSAAICSAGYAEKAGDARLDEAVEPTFSLLYNAAGIPILIRYSPDDDTNPAKNTTDTIEALEAAGASCNTM